MAETLFTIYMNRNSNVVSTVWLSNGERVTFSHRNSLMGWVNALKRRGVNPDDVVDSCNGLPESDLVA